MSQRILIAEVENHGARTATGGWSDAGTCWIGCPGIPTGSACNDRRGRSDGAGEGAAWAVALSTERAATLVSRVTVAMQLDQFCREHEELIGVPGKLWELAEPGSGDQQQALVLLPRQMVWLAAEADRMELVSELALTTVLISTGMATGL